MFFDRVSISIVRWTWYMFPIRVKRLFEPQNIHRPKNVNASGVFATSGGVLTWTTMNFGGEVSRRLRCVHVMSHCGYARCRSAGARSCIFLRSIVCIVSYCVVCVYFMLLFAQHTFRITALVSLRRGFWHEEVILTFPTERPVFLREFASETYSVWAYVGAKSFSVHY